MKALFCPSCGAQISLDDSRDFGFCQYCGAKVLLDDYRSTHRVVDEARIHETETDRIVRLCELELKEKQQQREHNQLKGIMIGWAIAGGGSILLLLILGLLGVLG